MVRWCRRRWPILPSDRQQRSTIRITGKKVSKRESTTFKDMEEKRSSCGYTDRQTGSG